MRKLVLLPVFLIFVLQLQAQETLLLRHPSISNNKIAFAYGSDIWTVNRDGSNAQLPGLVGLPADYYNQYVQRVMAVTAADLQRVARQYLQPDRAVVVVVGDQGKILPGLRALNLGTVETRPSTDFVR